jgi:hypothetical protein
VNMKKGLLPLIALCLLVINSQAQMVANEKVFLHTDRTLYLAGDTVFFKAYVFNNGNWSNFSTNLWVQLQNEKDSMIAKARLPLFLGAGAAQLTLPATLQGKTYQLMAYTDGMMGSTDSLFFRQRINVQGASVKASAVQNNIDQWQMYFFPEGGALVNSLESNVAFALKDGNGQALLAKGKIVDQAGNTVSQFESEHKGLGSFFFTPKAGEQYTALLDKGNGALQRFALPPAKANGLVLNVFELPGKQQFTINTNEPAAKKMRILFTQALDTFFSAMLNLTENSYTGEIATKDLKTGVYKLTLLSENQLPIAERIVFVRGAAKPNTAPILSPVRINKAPFELNNINIQLPKAGNLSVSITDAEEDFYFLEQNIITAFSLTSELKGSIGEPAAYFTATNADSLQRQLDLVMLTHGWRNYNTQLRPRPNSFITISGKVPDADLKQSFPKPAINLMMKGNKGGWLTEDLDAKGHFKVEGLLLFDSTKIFYSMNGAKRKNRFEFDQQPQHNTSSIYQAGQFLASTSNPNKQYDLYNKFGQTLVGTELAEVRVKAKAKSREQQLDEQYASGMFSGGYAKIYEMDSLMTGFTNFLDYLSGRIPSLSVVTGENGGYDLIWRGNQQIVFYIDQQQADENAVIALNMNDIAMFKFYTTPFILNGMGQLNSSSGMDAASGIRGGGASGTIAIFTKNGSGGTATQAKTAFDIHEVNGYTVMRQCYSPDYDMVPKNSDDKRITLKWEPWAVTDKQGRLSIPFFNNSRTKKFRVVLQGADMEGNLYYEEKIF